MNDVNKDYYSKEFEDYQKSFEMFCNEMQELSKKYGIAKRSTGGVSYGKIEDISYNQDLSSGDLYCNIVWGE